MWKAVQTVKGTVVAAKSTGSWDGRRRALVVELEIRTTAGGELN